MRFRILGPAGLALLTAAAAAQPATDPAEAECLALNIYWEARSEPAREQAAVAHVTLNRVRHPEFPDTICGVMKQGVAGACQFSWWCDGKPDEPDDAEAWAEVQRLARAVLKGEVPDPTGGALYFHHEELSPEWATAMEQTAVLGPHVFYR